MSKTTRFWKSSFLNNAGFLIACQLLRNQTSELKIGCYFNVTYDIGIFTRSIGLVAYLGLQAIKLFRLFKFEFTAQ